MKREQGVVVSDASELLFEDIKKLNAQQRPDVPTCLIYAPISLLPMSTKHQHIFYLFKLAEAQAHPERERRAAFSVPFAVSVIWHCGTISETFPVWLQSSPVEV